jgi:streptogramin lyase
MPDTQHYSTRVGFGGRARWLTLALPVLVGVMQVGVVGLAAASPAQQALEPTAPENLRCAGVPAPPLPGPGYTIEPVWDWRDVATFPGSDNDQGLYAVALDRNCNSYVGDASNYQIVKLSRDGTKLGEWKLPGTRAAGATSSPHGVAVDGQGNVYATEPGLNLVYKFSPAGQVTDTWGQCTPSAANNQCDPRQPGLFIDPEAIAVDGLGNVYVAEGAGDRIQKLTSSGKPQALWDMAGRVPGTLFILGGMALDHAGNLYVAEEFNNQVFKLNPNGDLVGRWGGPDPGSGPGEFHGPRGVAVDASGNMYVTDRDNWRVQKLAPDGSFLDQWRNCLIGTVQDCQTADAGDQPGQFKGARGLKTDGQGTVYVADTGNGRVERYMVVDFNLIPPPDDDDDN